MDPEPGSLTYAKQVFNFSRCLGSLICKMQTQYSFRIPPGVVGRFTSGDVKPHNMPATLTNVRRANPTLGPHRDTDWVLFLPFRRWQAWGADTAQYLSGDCGTKGMGVEQEDLGQRVLEGRSWRWTRHKPREVRRGDTIHRVTSCEARLPFRLSSAPVTNAISALLGSCKDER